MNEPYREHPSEEALERFLLNMSPEEELDSLEPHILACEYCVDQLELLETQITATRLALQTLEAQRTLKRTAKSASRWRSWLTIPKLSFAATGAVAMAAALLLSIPRDVSITAYRGTETVIVSEGRPLHMHLNAAGLDGGLLTVELADAQGSTVWKGTAVVKQDRLDVDLPRIMRSGSHLLRLYSPSPAGTEGRLLREFSLDAEWTM